MFWPIFIYLVMSIAIAISAGTAGHEHEEAQLAIRSPTEVSSAA